MGSFSEFNQQDYEVIAREYADLKEAARKRCADQSELDMIQKAFEFANEAHKGQLRKSGEAYIIHPLWVAIILADLEMDKETIVSGILHDVVEDTIMTDEEIKKEINSFRENGFDEKVSVAVLSAAYDVEHLSEMILLMRSNPSFCSNLESIFLLSSMSPICKDTKIILYVIIYLDYKYDDIYNLIHNFLML